MQRGKYGLDHQERKRWLPLAALGGALVLWAVFLGLGAFLEPSADRPRHDPRKFLIVLAAMAGFLTFWGLALWVRSRRK
jgi:hypothetical protein